MRSVANHKRNKVDLVADRHKMTRIFKGIDVRWYGSLSWMEGTASSEDLNCESTWINGALCSASWIMRWASSESWNEGLQSSESWREATQ